MTPIRVRGAAGGAVAALFTFAAFGIAQNISTESPSVTQPIPPGASPPDRSPAAHPPTAIRQSLAIFRSTRPRAAQDSVPAAESLDFLRSRHGANLARSRRVVDLPRRTVWLAPSEDGVCLLDFPQGARGPGGGCFAADTVLEGRAWQTIGTPANGATLLAIVPDGVDSVDVAFDDGTSESVAPRSNVVSLMTHRATTSDSYEYEGRIRTVSARTFDG